MKNDTRVAVSLFFIAFHCYAACGQGVMGIVNSYFHLTSVNMATNMVTVDDATGLTVGQRVLLYQAKGAAITATNSSAYGDISAVNNAGGYEFNNICSISGNNVWLSGLLLHPYDPNGQVQLVTVPSSSSITISGTVTAMAWDPATGKGGIVALEASVAIYHL